MFISFPTTPSAAAAVIAAGGRVPLPLLIAPARFEGVVMLGGKVGRQQVDGI